MGKLRFRKVDNLPKSHPSQSETKVGLGTYAVWFQRP